MKRIMLSILCLSMMLAASAQVKRTDNGVTFTVDENLPEPSDIRYTTGDNVAKQWLSDKGVSNDLTYLASSFKDARLARLGDDVLYRTFVRAYADHHPLVLSPDMIWLNICQVFSHYVNEHAEEMRDRFVSHDGQMTLNVEAGASIFSDNFDWDATIEGFISQISENTKGDIADIMIADFSTTSSAERIASGATLMDTMKEYFEYVVRYITCGIPNITLTGTPDDWKAVMNKAEALGKYDMEWYTKPLKPILKEFVRAAEGKPNLRFWKDIVMLDRPDRLRGGGCSHDPATSFDGWFTKLFPYDKDGKLESDPSTITQMLPSMVRVPFRYVEHNPTTGEIEKDLPMELWAGFVGVEYDLETGALTPKIGWMARQADTDEQIVAQLKDEDTTGLGIDIRVNKVPEVLRNLKKIKGLTLRFIHNVEIPEWMDQIEITHLIIEGKVTEAEKADILRRFPKASITSRQ